MSLKIEQRLDNNSISVGFPKLYTNGAKVVPLEITENGKKRYVWVVDEFCDDTYNDNGDICSPCVYSNKLDDLINRNEI